MYNIYEIRLPGWLHDNCQLAFTKGDCLRTCHNYSDMVWTRDRIHETKVAYTGDLVKDVTDNLWMDLYRARKCDSSMSQDNYSPWYVDADAAKMYAKNTWGDSVDVIIEHGSLTKQRCFPLKVPFQATLKVNDRGFYTEFDRHEDVTGGWGSKYFFIDRECHENLYPGEIIVTKVKEFNKYGFIHARMMKYTTPPEEYVAELLANRDMLSDTYVETLSVPNGKVMLIRSASDSYCDIPILYVDECNPDVRCRYMYWHLLRFQEKYPDAIQTVEKVSAEDFLCTGYQGMTLDVFIDSFLRVPFKGISGSKTEMSFNATFNEATKLGYLTLYKYAGVLYVETTKLRRDMLNFAIDFTEDEISDIRNTMLTINEKATCEFHRLATKGKINIVPK